MNPIVLSIKRGRFRQDDIEAEPADAAFKEARGAAISRDKSTCQYCDFKADLWQDVHHKNDDHHHNELENLITTCKFCHACYHIGLAGMNGGGSLIYLPEIGQTELNRLVRIMYITGKTGSDEWRDRAKNLWLFLLSREKVVKDTLGSAEATPLANALAGASQRDFEDRANRLDGLRFLIKQKSPMLALPKGGTVIDYWVSKVYNKVPESTWMDIAEQTFSDN